MDVDMDEDIEDIKNRLRTGTFIICDYLGLIKPQIIIPQLTNPQLT